MYRSSEIKALATAPYARVMTFIDGQNLYQSCKRAFQHALCHPHLLAEHLAGPRIGNPVTCRFYTGRPTPDANAVEAMKARNLDRRLAVMRNSGTVVTTRPLGYRWDWLPQERLPDARPHLGPRTVELHPRKRSVEKGIDLCIGLEVLEYALTDGFDVAVVVSMDRDLCEIAVTLRRLQELIGRPIRIEAAIPARAGQSRTISGYDYTHQITREVFQLIRDDTDYTAKPEDWKPPRPPATLAEARLLADLTVPADHH